MAKVSLCVLTSATDIANFQMQGLAFDSLETVFKATDVKMMLDLEPLAVPTNSTVFVVVDPAAGGPSSDYAVVSIARVRGTVNVSFYFLLFFEAPALRLTLFEKDDEVHIVFKFECCIRQARAPFGAAVVDVHFESFFVEDEFQRVERDVENLLRARIDA